jgi:hypothetical protein
MFSAPYPYSPLSSYDWAFTSTNKVPTGCGDILWNPVMYFLLAGFQVCSLFMGIELFILLFDGSERRGLSTFGKSTSAYIWSPYNLQVRSMMISICGASLCTTANMGMMFTTQLFIMNLVSDIGWTIVTTGFSLVLYSRLHLVNPGK